MPELGGRGLDGGFPATATFMCCCMHALSIVCTRIRGLPGARNVTGAIQAHIHTGSCPFTLRAVCGRKLTWKLEHVDSDAALERGAAVTL